MAKYPMIRWLFDTFISGLFTFLPICATAFCFIWIGTISEQLLGGKIEQYLPNEYQKGMGIAAMIVLVFLLGLLAKLWIVNRVMSFFTGLLERIPLVKTVYGAIRDVIEFVFKKPGKKGEDNRMVVMLTLPGGWKQLGIVTRTDFGDMPEALRREIAAPDPADALAMNSAADTAVIPPARSDKDFLAVYVPFSYQLGGFTYFIERARLSPVEGMSVEDAMRYSVMAWMSGKAPEESARLESPSVPE